MSEQFPEKLDARVLEVGGVIILGAIMATLDITIVNIAIEHLSVEFDVPLTTIQWIATGYTLALATVIPLSGWAADRFGAKPVYLSAIAMFTAGSALSGAAWSAESLIAFRVLQGLGGGMLMPLGMMIITRAAGPARIGRLMSVLGVPMLLGPILGPILGGWLIEDVSWRWIFYINVPIGAVALFLGLKVLDRDEPKATQRLDIVGVLTLSPGLAALIYALAKVPEHNGVDSVEVYGPGLAGIALIVAFLWHAGKIPYALIDLRLFRNRGFAVASAAMIFFAFAMFGAMLLFPLYFQRIRHEGTLDAGLLIAPQGIGAMLAMPIAGVITDRFGAARIAQLGFVPILAGRMAVFTQIGTDTSYWTTSIGLFVMGLGMGLSMMPIMTAALQTLRESAVGSGSTSLNIIQQVGASMGTALLSVLLTNATTDRIDDLSGPPTPDAVLGAQADAFGATFWWALGLLAVALLPALLLPRGQSRPPEDPDELPSTQAVPVAD
jgi:EmrB/QacA subfamily drug resistance transporter